MVQYSVDEKELHAEKFTHSLLSTYNTGLLLPVLLNRLKSLINSVDFKGISDIFHFSWSKETEERKKKKTLEQMITQSSSEVVQASALMIGSGLQALGSLKENRRL